MSRSQNKSIWARRSEILNKRFWLSSFLAQATSAGLHALVAESKKKFPEAWHPAEAWSSRDQDSPSPFSNQDLDNDRRNESVFNPFRRAQSPRPEERKWWQDLGGGSCILNKRVHKWLYRSKCERHPYWAVCCLACRPQGPPPNYTMLLTSSCRSKWDHSTVSITAVPPSLLEKIGLWTQRLMATAWRSQRESLRLRAITVVCSNNDEKSFLKFAMV